MSPSNKQVTGLVILCIFLYTATLCLDVFGHIKLRYISFLNFFSFSLILLYWGGKQLRITQHCFELREMIFLSSEVLCGGIAVYSWFAEPPATWLAVLQYVIFAIHFIALVAMFIFMRMFMIKRLI